ncbi:MAG: sigma-70 family RNA polymerase sigma factor [Lewinellaceae bacterium]|nr:sigma-70 family RNA polymerase sigma factor [Saprospiraceae bacterium]MCB9340553.1 sigma-70 family RNA polymerase sigma factor [Lewinellaceae bacterium]
MINLHFQNDTDLLAALTGAEHERLQALQHFFKNPRLLQWVLRYVRQQGGSEEEGRDVFEESFIVFERQVRNGHFRGESSLETWFHGIARWQWLVHCRKKRPTSVLEHVQLPSQQPSPEKMIIIEERRVILERLLVQVGERCQKLLGFFQLDYSMKEIREKMGYASEQVAANEVHSCRGKLKKLIEQQPELHETLKHRT